MTQQTFSVSQNPRVVIQNVRGTITVHSWQDLAIHVRVNEDVAIAEQLYQEGDTLYLNGVGHDVELTVPYVKKGLFEGFLGGRATVSTDFSITGVEGAVTMEAVGNVDITRVSGDVDITQVEKNLRATEIPTLRERKGIGGDMTLDHVGRADIAAVGGSAFLQTCDVATTGAIGGSLKAERIAELLRCGAIGGSCNVQDSMSAEISVSNVGGSLNLEGVAHMPSCNVGGSANIVTDVPPGSSMRLVVGGSATITLPERPNVRMHIIAGSSIRGDILDRKYNNMANITLGDGSATLNLVVGGSVFLQNRNIASPARSTSGPGESARQESRESYTRKRQAILQMIAEGRITPEEGSALLDALG